MRNFLQPAQGYFAFSSLSPFKLLASSFPFSVNRYFCLLLRGLSQLHLRNNLFKPAGYLVHVQVVKGQRFSKAYWWSKFPCSNNSGEFSGRIDFKTALYSDRNNGRACFLHELGCSGSEITHSTGSGPGSFRKNKEIVSSFQDVGGCLDCAHDISRTFHGNHIEPGQDKWQNRRLKQLHLTEHKGLFTDIPWQGSENPDRIDVTCVVCNKNYRPVRIKILSPWDLKTP